MNIRYGIVFLLAGISSQLFAEENVIKGDKFNIRVGNYSILNDETTIGLLSDKIVGVSLSTTRDLGMAGRNNTVFIHGYYRFNPDHAVQYSWYRNNRKGETVLDKEFEWNGETYPVQANLKSEYDTSIYKASYQFSFHHDPKVELSLLAGLHITGIRLALEGTFQGDVVADEATSFTAPLPVVGFRMGYDIIPNKLVWTNQVEFFYLNFTDFQGSLTDFSTDIEWRFSKHVGVGAAIRSTRMALDAKVNGNNAINFLDSNSGITAYLSIYF